MDGIMAKSKKNGYVRKRGLINDARGLVKGVTKIAASGLIAAPVLIPVAYGIKDAMDGKGTKTVIDGMLYNGVGYNMNSGKFERLASVATRAIGLVAVGMGMRYLMRRV